jgi:DNA-directed RNA polymerase subunit RPC12/RpoP
MSDSNLNSAIVGAITGGVAVVFLFVIGRKKKLKIDEGSKMGLNLSGDLKCPNCGTPAPAVRRPKNFRQFMWGGWTCANCGKEFDKWLKPVDGK